MPCNKRFSNWVTQSVLEIGRPHFTHDPRKLGMYKKDQASYFSGADQVTQLVNHYYIVTNTHANSKLAFLYYLNLSAGSGFLKLKGITNQVNKYLEKNILPIGSCFMSSIFGFNLFLLIV